MSHPSLGLPPRDPLAGLPDAARRIRDAAPRLADRALTVAIDRDPTMRERWDEVGLRARLHDARLLIDQLAVSVASGEPDLMREHAESVAPVYRRKGVSMDDLTRLCEGIRDALPDVLTPPEMPLAEAGLDAASGSFRWHRRLAGDARRKNPLLQFIYKGG